LQETMELASLSFASSTLFPTPLSAFLDAQHWVWLTFGSKLFDPISVLVEPVWTTSLFSRHLSTIVSTFFVIFTMVFVFIHIIALVYARHKLHEPIRVLSEYVGVSIIKPL
ncbi:hypothetical protein PMAYCL1PPCAC_16547, partial [Pristionchus mayeri]